MPILRLHSSFHYNNAQAESEASEDPDQAEAAVQSKEVSDSSTMTRKAVTQYAVPALSLLGELLAPLLDIIYQSDEKDKVMPLLYTVMYNVIPYLRQHSRGNLSSFRAGSRLLAELSEYQYTRKSWKKDTMELLLDGTFFQMDLQSLQSWRVTVDNLMTHDKTTFKELMSESPLLPLHFD